MARVLVLAVLFVVALDFSTADAVLCVGVGRSAQWDDEEDAVPARRPREFGEERRVAAFPGAPRPIAPGPPRPSTARRARLDRLDDRAAGLLPFRQALTPSVRSASPPDDH